MYNLASSGVAMGGIRGVQPPLATTNLSFQFNKEFMIVTQYHKLASYDLRP